jgi:hypothetical protein
MFPEQPQQQNGSQPQYAPPQPQQQYGYAPPQPNQQGQYDVLPPLPTMQNNGHTGHNPYEFIVNPNQPKRKGKLFGGDAFLMRLALIAGGAVVLMIVAGVIISAMGPKSNTASLLGVAERQQEIIRIAKDAGTQATGSDVQNFAASVLATVTSDQVKTITYLKANGMKKIPTKTLNLDQSAQTDATLAAAATAGTYDTAVMQNLSSQLATYEQLLQSSYKLTTGKNGKALLQTSFKSADALAQQAKTVSGTSQ